MKKITSIDGKSLIYNEDMLHNNPYIRGSLIHNHFFAYNESDELLLQWEFKYIKRLIPYIREGIFYRIEDGDDKQEIEKMLEYLSVNNTTKIYELYDKHKNGTIDKDGFNVFFDIDINDDTLVSVNNKNKVEHTLYERVKNIFLDLTNILIKCSEIPDINYQDIFELFDKTRPCECGEAHTVCIFTIYEQITQLFDFFRDNKNVLYIHNPELIKYLSKHSYVHKITINPQDFIDMMIDKVHSKK